MLIGLVVLTLAALGLRGALLKAGNADIHLFRDWLEFLREHGGLRALRYEVGNYTPVYSYLLLAADATLLGVVDIVVIKAPAIAADVVCAAFVYRIVRMCDPVGLLPLAAYASVLFLPTVVVNSAYWGQTDMLWTAPIVASLYFLLRGRHMTAFVFVGLALAFKQQAIFLGPFLVLLAAKRVVPWRTFLVLPAVYAAMMLPAFIAGRSAWNLLTIYWEQAGTHELLTLTAANVYQWFPDSSSNSVATVAGFAALAVLALIVWAALVRVSVVTPSMMLALATASVLVTPFVLPRMHDRYFFAGDVLSVILAFFVPRLIPVAVLVQFASFFSYSGFLLHRHPVPEEVLALVMLVAITILLRWIRTNAASIPRQPDRPRIDSETSRPASQMSS